MDTDGKDNEHLLDQFFIHFHKDLIHDNIQKDYFTLQTLIIYFLFTISPLFYFKGHTLITLACFCLFLTN